MKSPINEFFTFSRMERLGFSILAILILLSLGFRFWLAFQTREAPEPSGEDQRLAIIYKEWKKKLDASTPLSNNPGQNVRPFFFDPNTLDSAGFIRLGLPPGTVRGLLNWRKKGKQFRKPDELAALYNLPKETFERLKPFIRIEKFSNPDYANSSFFVPRVIDINTADSAMLDRAIPGIGAVLAHKIVARRTALGGFLKLDQLLEVYPFRDSIFQKIKERLSLNPGRVLKMDLNKVDESRLAQHPYIGPGTAKNILLYRDGIGHYSRIEQLREVPLMSEEIYRKIAPYFIIK